MNGQHNACEGGGFTAGLESLGLGLPQSEQAKLSLPGNALVDEETIDGNSEDRRFWLATFFLLFPPAE